MATARFVKTLAVALGTFTLMAIDAQAAMPRDVDDLVGARGGSGESELQRRGYEHRKTLKVANGSIAYWWNARRGACIAVTTTDGRYKAIATQPDAVCEGGGGGMAGGRDVDDLVGARAGSGERSLNERGYRVMNTQKGDGRAWTNWWRSSDRRCITVMTRDGRYEAITETLPADCHRGGTASGSEAPPGGFGKPTPRVSKVDGGHVAVDLGGCNVLFSQRGGIVQQGSSCSDGDVRNARDAFESFRREQNAPAGSEAPPGGFRGSGESGTLTCESDDGKYQFCRRPIGPGARVHLVRQLSNSACTRGTSWGHEADGIWVDKGCRAVFEVR